MTNEKLLDAIGKKSDAIDKQFQSIDKHFQSIDKRLDSIDSRLDHLEEFAEVTRNGVNVLIEWTEDVSNKLRYSRHFGAVDKVSHQLSRYAIMRKTA